MRPKRPLLRYYGGKFLLAPWIIGHFPEHRIYVEAFGGGGSVLLQKDPVYGEVYNDLDGEVVNVFRVLQRSHRRLKRLLLVTPFARDELEMAYRRTKDPVERARRTIVRSFMGFGADSVTRTARTGFRNNSNQGGTTPAHDWATWSNQIDAFTERLRSVVIENRDASEVMASQDSSATLHYVDPPYVHSTRKRVQSGHGYRFELTDLDHEKLAEFLAGLKGMVIVSGYDHPIYRGLGWHSESVETRTFQKFNAASARTELIWLNQAAVSAQAQQNLFRTKEASCTSTK